MASRLYGKISKPEDAHTLAEFIYAGKSIDLYYSYDNFSFMQNIDGVQYSIFNVIDDYIDELKQLCIEVKLTNKERETYIYNPKLLSYKLYKTTMLYWLILRTNNLCSAHEFNLLKKKILIIRPKALFDALNKIYNSEKKAIKIFNSTHENDSSTIYN